MADVFISYSQKDKYFTKQLAHLLSEAGMSVWYDADLRTGESFRDAIRREIDACKAAIALWSENSSSSDFVVDEADYARGQGKLISIIIDNEKHDVIPLGFRTAHVTKLSQGAEIVDALRLRGIAPQSSISAFVLELFEFRIKQQVAKSRQIWAKAIVMSLAIGLAAGAGIFALSQLPHVRLLTDCSPSIWESVKSLKNRAALEEFINRCRGVHTAELAVTFSGKQSKLLSDLRIRIRKSKQELGKLESDLRIARTGSVIAFNTATDVYQRALARHDALRARLLELEEWWSKKQSIPSLNK